MPYLYDNEFPHTLVYLYNKYWNTHLLLKYVHLRLPMTFLPNKCSWTFKIKFSVYYLYCTLKYRPLRHVAQSSTAYIYAYFNTLIFPKFSTFIYIRVCLFFSAENRIYSAYAESIFIRYSLKIRYRVFLCDFTFIHVFSLFLIKYTLSKI